eukprot:GEMP01066961.1.p1 GENE.GEMP01066961.1~~GEMP01066961.1.p1  ORF type:complete len:268 (+),score=62.81 GEMP01066961.1:337-1140(+)
MRRDARDESDLFEVDAEEEIYAKVPPTAIHSILSPHSMISSTRNDDKNGSRHCPLQLDNSAPQWTDHHSVHNVCPLHSTDIHNNGAHVHHAVDKNRHGAGGTFPGPTNAGYPSMGVHGTRHRDTDAFPPHIRRGFPAVSRSEVVRMLQNSLEIEERRWAIEGSADMALVEDDDIIGESALRLDSDEWLVGEDSASSSSAFGSFPRVCAASHLHKSATPDPLRFQDERTLLAISNVIMMMESQDTVTESCGPLEYAIARALGYSVQWS